MYDEIVSIVRSRDINRYTAVFFADPRKREALLSLYAFNQELERIPFVASEYLVGEIRLQWWRDALGQIRAGNETGNPLADSLGRSIRKHNLPETRLMELIDARSFDLSGELVEDLPELKVYVRKTAVSLNILALHILADEVDEQALSLAHDAGTAYGLALILSQLPQNAAAGKLHLPRSLLSAHNVDITATLSGVDTGPLRRVVQEIMEETEKHYTNVKRSEKSVPSKFGPVFLPVTLIRPYMKQLADGRHSLLRDVVSINPMYRLWKYWKAAAFGIY